VKQSLPTRALREHPDLDQLKRQAKELLAAFIAGEAEAVAEVKTHYHDAEAAGFALHDAQLVLARAYGFDSWPKLKAFVDGVTVARLADTVRAGDTTRVRAMIEARPELVNTDMAENDEHRAIHYAVLVRSPEMVRLLMEHGADARKGIYPRREATSALTLATERGYNEIVAIIREEEQRRHGRLGSPNAAADDLTEAIRNGNDARAFVMLESEPALVHACDRKGWTPLHTAAGMLNERLVDWLLAHGAEVNHRGPGDRTPLDAASRIWWWKPGAPEGFAAVARLLRARGAELTPISAVALGEENWLRARYAESALPEPKMAKLFDSADGLLTIAVKHDRPEILTLLLDLGFDPDERVRLDGLEEVVYSVGLPLWTCARSGKHALAEILLKRGANPNAHVYAGGSVMYSAYVTKDENMVKLLERYGGFVDADTAGHLRLTEQARQLLADHDAGRLRPGTFHGESLERHLLWAGLRGGDPEIVRMTLERIHWPSDDPEWFGLLWAPLPRHDNRSEEDQRLYLECFSLVLDRCGPNIVHPRVGRTILHDVAALDETVTPEEALGFATLLLNRGARTDVRDDLLESTPLGWACRWGRIELVKLFLERVADPVEAGAEPWATPKAWAQKMGHTEVLALLRSHGG
jgi:ankyrin repeat protein